MLCNQYLILINIINYIRLQQEKIPMAFLKNKLDINLQVLNDVSSFLNGAKKELQKNL